MAEARWEWVLPGGQRVVATLGDADSESVFLGAKLSSQCARGQKPEGHVVGPAVVTFDPRVRVCILRIAGEEVAPAAWPTPGRREPKVPPASGVSIPAWLGLAAVALLLAVALFLVRQRIAASRAEGGSVATYRAPSGLFVAHFPDRFNVRPAVAGRGATGALFTDAATGHALVILSVTADATAQEPWLLHKRLYDEALSNVPRKDARFEEVGRLDGTCLGRPGALVFAKVAGPKGEPLRVWSCALATSDAGYLVMTSFPDHAGDDEQALRAIIDATELTHLGELPP
jgi:hypothetical protein